MGTRECGRCGATGKGLWCKTGDTGLTLKRVMLWSTPEVQHISRMECMASCGQPMSSTRSPRREARMGPMVVPQGVSLRTMNSCTGTRPQQLPTLPRQHPSWDPGARREATWDGEAAPSSNQDAKSPRDGMCSGQALPSCSQACSPRQSQSWSPREGGSADLGGDRHGN